MRIRFFQADEDFQCRPFRKQVVDDVLPLVYYTMGLLFWVFLLLLLAARLKPANLFEQFGVRVLIGVSLVTWMAALLQWMGQKLSAYIWVPSKQSGQAPVKRAATLLPSAEPATQPNPANAPSSKTDVPLVVLVAANEQARPATVDNQALPAATATVATPLPTETSPVVTVVAASVAIQPNDGLALKTPVETVPANHPETVPTNDLGDLLNFLSSEVSSDDEAPANHPSVFDSGPFTVSSLSTPDKPYKLALLNPRWESPAPDAAQGIPASIAAYFATF